MNNKAVAAAIVGGIALLMDIVGLATPAWQIFTDASLGLFQLCYYTTGCFSLRNGTTAESVGAAFTILAMLVMLAALVLLIMSILEKGKFHKIAGILFLIAALFMVIAIASYIGIWISTTNRITTGYSLGLVIFSAILAFAAGITSIKSV